ncbi:hypothetical protein UK23_14930 [Lentzea aerocolonigenes]|uniref:Peptidase M4 C-terminal domain-containing protein n=2 Tax=Lentzea aerocolonigenes TaxID=68170 RepID=A0A0F0H106_LENAE|nr:hypothetical protein UK23_14930 [Lentzea aerocolonigenes]
MWLVAAVCAGAVLALTAGQSTVYADLPDLVPHDAEGHVVAVGGDPRQDAPDAAGIEQAARRNLAALDVRYGRSFGDLEVVSTRRTIAGTVVRARQVFRGTPVEGAEVVQVYDARGGFVGAVGHVVLARQGDFPPDYDADVLRDRAVRAVAASASVPAQDLSAEEPAPVWHDPDLARPGDLSIAVPAFKVTVRGTAPDHAWTAVLHATEDEVLEVRPAVLGVVDHAVCDARGKVVTGAPATVRCGLTFPIADPGAAKGAAATAYARLADVSAFYSRFLRTDLVALIGTDAGDEEGLALRATVRVCAAGGCPYRSSFWNGEQLVFGDVVTDAVVGHEVAHAVAARVAGDPVTGRAREVAEGMADVLGQFAAIGSGPAGVEGGDRWQFTDPASGEVRNMADPGLSAVPQPASVGGAHWQSGATDPHVNAGVVAKAAALLVDGGEVDGQHVQGIGLDKAVAIWWGAQNYLTPSATFLDLANALEISCNVAVRDVVNGVDWEDCDSVSAVITATRLDSPAE